MLILLCCVWGIFLELLWLLPLGLEGIIGILGGIYACKLIQKHDINLIKYFFQAVISVLAETAFILCGNLLYSQYFEGYVYGGILGAIAIGIFWIMLIKNPADRKILFFINPLNYAFLIVIALLISWKLSPTVPLLG